MQGAERAVVMSLILRRRLIRWRSAGPGMADRERTGRRRAHCKGRTAEAGREELHIKAEDGESGAEPTPYVAARVAGLQKAAPARYADIRTASSADAIEHPRAPLVTRTLTVPEQREKREAAAIDEKRLPRGGPSDSYIAETAGGDGGIRTLDRALQPYNGLANRRLQPLGHVSGRAEQCPSRDRKARQASSRLRTRPRKLSPLPMSVSEWGEGHTMPRPSPALPPRRQIPRSCRSTPCRRAAARGLGPPQYRSRNACGGAPSQRALPTRRCRNSRRG
jgi:hypothetical protein